jgi:hypothetical protein
MTDVSMNRCPSAHAIGRSNYRRNNLQESVSNVDLAADIEVILAPNFDSENPFEVLGCHSEADTQELDRAYRDLSRKYHPENTSAGPCLDENDVSKNNSNNNNDSHHDAANNLIIFQKVSQAHARATGKEDIPMTQEDALGAYESKFGKYRDMYCNEGGLIGIPYSSDLKERLEKSEFLRNWTSLSLCRFGDCKRLRIIFFRAFLIKKEMIFWLCMAEIFLTWAVIAFCE